MEWNELSISVLSDVLTNMDFFIIISLGPTLKLKRQTVYDKYSDTISSLYN